jgi:hypothetical protein
MATVDQLLQAAKQAEAAGNEDDVRIILQEIKRMRSQQAPERAPIEKPKATTSGAVRTLAQGILLGFGDEAEAYVRSTFSGQDRDELLAEIRKDIAQYGAARPKTATALEIGGAVLPSLIPAGLVARGAMAGAGAAGLGATAARGAAAGAVEGGIAGFGAGEGGLTPRLEIAATGAALGGALGGAVPFAAAGAADIGRRALDGLGLSGAQRARTLAERRVGKALEREGLTPETAMGTLERAQAAGAPMMPADIGEATRGAAYAAQAVPSARRTGVLEALTERSVEQGSRIADTTAEKMDAAGAYGLDYLDDIYESASEKFKPLYEAADVDVSSEPFRKYANRRVFKDAFRAIQSRADTLGEAPIKDLETALAGDVVPTSYLQKIAQGLDRVIAQNTDTVTGKLNDRAKDVLTVRNEFKSVLGNLNEAYAKADSQFADMMDLRRAFDVGDAFEKLDPQQFSRKVKAMKPDEVEAMKVGMITRIRNIASGSDRTDYVQRLFGSPKRREALKQAFPSEQAFNNFESYMNAEAAIQRTQRRVLGGSDTQRNIQEMAEQGVDPATLLQLMTGGRGEAVRQAAGALSSRMQGIGAPVAEQMSDILFAQGLPAQRQAMGRLSARQMQDEMLRRRLTVQPELYGGILGAAIGLNQRESGY